MAEPKKVAVVILSWNGKKFLEQFMPAVIQHTNPQLCEIIVADNLSSDDSVDFLKRNYPTVRIIENRRNGGYAGGYNDALKLVDTEYYVLLNQDIEVTPNWVEAVIGEMEKDSRIAAAQPKLRAYDRRDEFEYAGAAGGYLDRFGYPFCRGRVFEKVEKDTGQYDEVKDIFWASGACLFVRSKAYWEAGGLDEDFFAHQEEIDLCWRIDNLGHRTICVPQSVVYHVGGGSLQYGNPRKTYLNFRNSLMMMFKNLPLSQLWWKMPLRLNLDSLAAGQALVSGNWQTFVAILKSQFYFFFHLPMLIGKRSKVKRKTAASLYPISIVWKYFYEGKTKFSEL
ncbi:MAG: glycosyltransferase family 2 protein [Chitinophagales bacterium]